MEAVRASRQAGLFSDATVIFDSLAPAHQYLAVVARSLGSGVAMHLAAGKPIGPYLAQR
jgi:hypothetical protein